MTVNKSTLICWALFFISPLFWPKIVDSYLAMDLLAFACGLTAAAMSVLHNEAKTFDKSAWCFLALLLLPITFQLLFLDIGNPWKAWQMALYISSAWLIYRMAGEGLSKQMLGSLQWIALLACMGNFYVLFAILGEFQLHLLPQFEVFPIWLENPTRFGGVLIQPNLQGLFLAIVSVALWARALSDSRYWPWLMASILPCAGLFATSSRGSAIVLAAGVLILLVLCKKKASAFIKLSGAILTAFAFVEYWYAFDTLNITRDTLMNRFEVAGISARLFIWDMAWRLFLDNIWFGIGAGNLISYGLEAHIPTLAAHPEWGDTARNLSGGHAWAHNLVLQFFCEWGVLGGFSIIGLIGAVIYKGFHLAFVSKVSLSSGEFQAALGLMLMLMHGMVSVSMMQGFFLVLLALYASALFSHSTPDHSLTIFKPHHRFFRLSILLLPAIVMLYNWQLFISRELAIERVINLPVKSEQFILGAATAISSPWSSRAALEWYFASLVSEGVKPNLLIQSENLAYQFWLLHQSDLSLRYLILIAHLKDDTLTEKRLAKIYHLASPNDVTSIALTKHVEQGHENGESIDIWH